MSLLIKPNDPLAKSGPDQQRIIFQKMVEVSRGHSIDEVAGAAINMLVNALRQSYPDQAKAMAALDQKLAKSRELLAANYNSGGRLKGVFPFNQTIELAHFHSDDKIRG